MKYKIQKSIGKGGMGEVHLAHDPLCGREVALKQMREEWIKNPTMQERFLREARIAAQLSHPSIIAIYDIDPDGAYYTMPHVEGETLKAILKRTKKQMKNGETLDSVGSSIPALIRIFLNVCEAISYAHDRGVLHRDLKPENIIVGKYGEVIILDWGLADFIEHPENNGLEFEEMSGDLTKPGKVPGTLLYLAPERAFGEKSSCLTDIYSLGVMLYQILTLQYPFQRKTLKEFRKTHMHEEILDPEEIAPDREISPVLSQIAKRCLEKNMSKRYQSVTEIIQDLKNYIEGVPEWIDAATLHIERKEDWQFQENIAMTRHMALTRSIETLEWMSFMLSKGSFPGNIQIQTELTIEDGSKGLGILFCTVENNFEEGYCLWFSDEGIALYRSNVKVYENPEMILEKNTPYKVQIELIDNHIRFLLDGIQKFTFLSHIPLPGTHVGLLLRDEKFSIIGLKISDLGQTIMVNCLAVPDSFAHRKNYNEALKEYRKISHSFPGRAEGREAIFRAGLTLLKKAAKRPLKALYQEALDEFEKLHATAGEPLEYLGKSLVYKAQKEYEEEAKCFELALRKFPKHPLKPILVETLLTRLYESSKGKRHIAYRFALIALTHLPAQEIDNLIDVLEKSLEPLPFFTPSQNRKTHLAIQLAFWLNFPFTIVEMIEKGLGPIDENNAHIALVLLGHQNLADSAKIKTNSHAEFEYCLKNEIQLPEDSFLEKATKAIKEKDWETARSLFDEPPSEKDPHFFLYGCYLAKTKGKKAALDHLTSISEKAHPPLSTLLSHFLIGRIDLEKGWIETAFTWEQLKLYQQLKLYKESLEE